MSSVIIIKNAKNDTDFLVQELPIEIQETHKSVSLFKPEMQTAHNTILTPSAVNKLTEQNVNVCIQNGFANDNPYSTDDYTSVGARFVEKEPDLALASKILVKYDAFSAEQIQTIQSNKILLTTLLPDNLTTEYITLLNRKRITAISLGMVRNEEKEICLDVIRSKSLSDFGFQLALSNFILPIVETLVFSPNITTALHHEPRLLQAIYCYKGHLCSEDIAKKLGLPHNDILSLSWDLN